MKKCSPKAFAWPIPGRQAQQEEYAQCEKSAAPRSTELSKWCRQVLLELAAGTAQAPGGEVIPSEIPALRKIVINLLYGENLGAPLSEERMRELIEDRGCRLGQASQSSGTSSRRSDSTSWSLER
jgi:hypothetical protein